MQNDPVTSGMWLDDGNTIVSHPKNDHKCVVWMIIDTMAFWHDIRLAFKKIRESPFWMWLVILVMDDYLFLISQ